MMTALAWAGGGAVALGAFAACIQPRLELSRAKHPSLAGHARLARRVAKLLPFYDYDAANFFCCDDPPAVIAEQRRNSFRRLSALCEQKFARTRAMSAEVAPGLSDLQFTSAYRVPFQFSRVVREHLSFGSFLESSDGVTITDHDGNTLYDLAGSYGVNLFGTGFYKSCIAAGAAAAQSLGPVLGAYHPTVVANVARLRALSGLDEVSFHMSGTEAVMQAVRLARFHTGRTHLVRFAGAYHGWWGDVQPGIGNPLPPEATYTLADMSERSLAVLRRRRDIACVLVNPIQALHPNAGPPADSALVDSARRAGLDRAAYTEWLKRLRAVCSERGIILILDDIFLGFRLAPGGAQEYFGVRADLVTYGKTVGGGLPVGVLCGRAGVMRRFRSERPGDVCLARGTFGAHPYVMATMAEFFRRFDLPETQALYAELDALWNGRADALNARLAADDIPVRIAAMSTVWTVSYLTPSRFNWLLQYYLRLEGIALSWVGTGRLIFSLDYTTQDFADVADRFVAACRAMREDGWWWWDGTTTNRSIRRRVLREMLARQFGKASSWPSSLWPSSWWRKPRSRATGAL